MSNKKLIFTIISTVILIFLSYAAIYIAINFQEESKEPKNIVENQYGTIVEQRKLYKETYYGEVGNGNQFLSIIEVENKGVKNYYVLVRSKGSTYFQLQKFYR